MPSPVESAIRGVVTKGVLAVAGFNRERKKAKEPNLFIEGIHKPLTQELTETELKVTGEIPAALNGLYVRNGPNPLGKVNPATHHWFLGDAMLHGVRLEGGRANLLLAFGPVDPRMAIEPRTSDLHVFVR